MVHLGCPHNLYFIWCFCLRSFKEGFNQNILEKLTFKVNNNLLIDF